MKYNIYCQWPLHDYAWYATLETEATSFTSRLCSRSNHIHNHHLSPFSVCFILSQTQTPTTLALPSSQRPFSTPTSPTSPLSHHHLWPLLQPFSQHPHLFTPLQQRHPLLLFWPLSPRSSSLLHIHPTLPHFLDIPFPGHLLFCLPLPCFCQPKLHPLWDSAPRPCFQGWFSVSCLCENWAAANVLKFGPFS